MGVGEEQPRGVFDKYFNLNSYCTKIQEILMETDNEV